MNMAKNKKYTVKYAVYRGKKFIKNILINNTASVEQSEAILNNIISKTMPLNDITAKRRVSICNS